MLSGERIGLAAPEKDLIIVHPLGNAVLYSNQSHIKVLAARFSLH